MRKSVSEGSATVCKNAKHLLQDKKYKFWLVASGMDTREATRHFDHLKDRLFNELKSVLTGKILDDVEIMPSYTLATKLSQHAATT